MKIKIRRGVFETNSSSVHTLTIVPKSVYEQWCKKSDNFLYIPDNDWGSSNDDEKFKQANKIYTLDELSKWVSEQERYRDEELDISEVLEIIKNNGFTTYYGFMRGDYSLEVYSENYKTESGDEIVVFGKY